MVALAPAQAGFFGPDEITLWFRADITVGPDGRVKELEWRNYKPMPAPAVQGLERHVRAWRFRPTIEVAPGEAITTTLTVQLTARERKDGEFGLYVEEAFTGPSLLDVPNEDGWQRWERIDSGYRPASVEIVYEVDWNAGAAQRIELIEFGASNSRKEYRAAQEARADTQIRAWTVKPETVSGRPVDARFRYLYAHCVIPAWCDRNDFRRFRGLPEVPRGDPVPLSSVLQLETPVRDLEL